MNNALNYLIEKFQQAVCELAVGEGDARSRVGVAFYIFWTIPIDEFPETLRKDREKITTLLTRLGAKIPENLRRMKNSTACQIATLILRIYFRLIDLRTDEVT